MKDKFWLWLAHHMPKDFVYWCAIRVWAHATTGKHSNTEVPSLTVITALERWRSA